MELSPKNVKDLVMACLFTQKELEADPRARETTVMVEGITMKIRFHPERIKEKAPEIRAFLDQLSDDFRKGKGGGTSFLQMCVDKDGRQWGEHRDMQGLMLLGIGSGQMEYTMPRAMWGTLPGGMPYLTILEPKETTDVTSKQADQKGA